MILQRYTFFVYQKIYLIVNLMIERLKDLKIKKLIKPEI
jgi:hypothetical protein